MTKIALRPVTPADLPILFAQQNDPESNAMAEYPPKDRGEFMRHWDGLLQNKNVTTQAILYKGKLAGHVLCWKDKYEQKFGYWLGREFWGRGIASAAVAEFLKQVSIRPLFAYVAHHNIGSKRVLEKNGFTLLDDSGKLTLWKLS